MSSKLKRLQKDSRICNVILTILMIYTGLNYVANSVCVFVAPEAPIIGTTEHKKVMNPNGSLRSETYQTLGFPRTFLTLDADHSLVFKVGKSHTPWRNVTLTAKLTYFFYLSLFTAVLLPGINQLRKLFGFFAQGVIFTPETIRELQNFGRIVLIWAVVSFLGTIAVIIVSRELQEPSGVTPEIPILPLFIGFLISLIAEIFAEGRRLDEETRLTI
jgi:Protein of unknown function (DUF2975)